MDNYIIYYIALCLCYFFSHWWLHWGEMQHLIIPIQMWFLTFSHPKSTFFAIVCYNLLSKFFSNMKHTVGVAAQHVGLSTFTKAAEINPRLTCSAVGGSHTHSRNSWQKRTVIVYHNQEVLTKPDFASSRRNLLTMLQLRKEEIRRKRMTAMNFFHLDKNCLDKNLATWFEFKEILYKTSQMKVKCQFD